MRRTQWRFSARRSRNSTGRGSPGRAERSPFDAQMRASVTALRDMLLQERLEVEQQIRLLDAQVHQTYASEGDWPTSEDESLDSRARGGGA